MRVGLFAGGCGRFAMFHGLVVGYALRERDLLPPGGHEIDALELFKVWRGLGLQLSQTRFYKPSVHPATVPPACVRNLLCAIALRVKQQALPASKTNL